MRSMSVRRTSPRSGRSHPSLGWARYTWAMSDPSHISRLILDELPQTQAIYLFGSAAADQMLTGSDVDIAVLLPASQAKRAGSLAGSPLHLALEDSLSRDVDLLNLRQLSTVMQKEVIAGGRRIQCSDVTAADEFEMHVLSLYQKLNAERAGIVAEGLSSGHFLKQ